MMMALDSAPAPVRVGLVLREPDLRAARNDLGGLTGAAADAGIDHLTVGDHVSFSGGAGNDGLIYAAALLGAHPSLEVQTGIFLLALRHPAIVARQLTSIADFAPGRLTFGIGVGGDDPGELRLCGVDPGSRGARTSEALELVQSFLRGEEVSFEGRFYSVEKAAIRPAPEPPIPVLVGGRSDAALRRTGRLGDGWIAVWVSPRRFAEAGEIVREAALRAGRDAVAWRHTLQMWSGIDSTPERGAARLRPVMESAYGMPFERFSRYCPCGPPEAIAAELGPFLEVGCRRFNFVCEADGLGAAIEAVGEVKRLLAGA